MARSSYYPTVSWRSLMTRVDKWAARHDLSIDFLHCRGHLEIQVTMPGTTRIERSPAAGTAVAAGKVFGNGQFPPAGAAQDGRHIKQVCGPPIRSMVRQLVVAAVAGVMESTARESDRDDIQGTGVMAATGVSVHANTLYDGRLRHIRPAGRQERAAVLEWRATHPATTRLPGRP